MQKEEAGGPCMMGSKLVCRVGLRSWAKIRPKFGLQKGFNSNLYWVQIELIILGSKIGPRFGLLKRASK